MIEYSSLQRWWATWAFQAQRADYYAYLGKLLQQTQGRKTLKDIFWDDADRYGAQHPRGILSRYWAQRYEDHGGDLSVCFGNTLPKEDVALIAMGQQAGGGALERTLVEVARIAAIQKQAKEQFVTTIAVGVLALLILVLALIAIPTFTVPKLQEAFVIPDEYLGRLTLRLYGFSSLIAYTGWFWGLAIGVGLFLALNTLPSWVGTWRTVCDRYAIWRVYAQYQSIRTLSILATVLQPRGNIQVSLREAFDILIDISPQKWLRWHLSKMSDRIDEGYVGAETFDTGLLDPETFWYLRDMVETQGVDEGLRQTQKRMEEVSLQSLKRGATVLRWVLLLSALAGCLAIAFWHMVAVQEMKQALISYYAYR